MNFLKKLSCVALLGAALCTTAIAIPITGTVTFSGRLTLDTDNVTTATQVSSWGAPSGPYASSQPIASDADGDLGLFITSGDAVSFLAPYILNSNASQAIWSVGGFTLTLATSSSSVTGFGPTAQLDASGYGTITGNGYTPTDGSWSFSTQNPGTNSTPARFTFSAGSTALPDGGSTALLIGIALVGLGSWNARRRKALKV